MLFFGEEFHKTALISLFIVHFDKPIMNAPFSMPTESNPYTIINTYC